MTDDITPSRAMPLLHAGAAQAASNFEPVMEHVIDLYESLETRYERLRLAYASLMETHMELAEQLHALQDPAHHTSPKLSEGIFMTNAAGTILTVNAAFTLITGYTADDAIGKNPRFMQSGLQDPSFYKDLWLEISNAGSWQGQMFNRRKNGEIYPEWIKISATKDRNGGVLSYTAVIYDLSGVASQEVKNLSKSLPQNVYRIQPAPGIPEASKT